MDERNPLPEELVGAPFAPQYSLQGARLAFRTRALQQAEVDVKYRFAHGNLCEAMMRPFVQVASLIDPADPYAPWEPLFNVEICPAEFLPWLAQVVGVRLPDGLTEEQARSFIKDLSFEEIGTPRALMAAVRSVLVPSNPPAPATVWFRERDGGDAYYIEIVTLIDETPDPAALDRVIASQLPAAIVISSREVEAWDYEQMTTEGGTYGDQKAAYTTYLKLREHEPA